MLVTEVISKVIERVGYNYIPLWAITAINRLINWDRFCWIPIANPSNTEWNERAISKIKDLMVECWNTPSRCEWSWSSCLGLNRSEILWKCNWVHFSHYFHNLEKLWEKKLLSHFKDLHTWGTFLGCSDYMHCKCISHSWHNFYRYLYNKAHSIFSCPH